MCTEQRGKLGRAGWHAGELLAAAAGIYDRVSALDRDAAVVSVEAELHLVLADCDIEKARAGERRQSEIIGEPVHKKIIPSWDQVLVAVSDIQCRYEVEQHEVRQMRSSEQHP